MLSLIGGVGVGAALMYLLDPDAGQRRRANLKSAAEHAAERSGDVLHNAWDMASERLAPLAERAGEVGASGVAAASSMGSRLAAGLADRAGSAADDFRDSASRHVRSARHTAAGWLGHREESHLPGATTTISAAAALAVGAGVMFLLDPRDGARRRAMLRGKMNHCLNETGDFFRRTGRHLANRSRGFAHDTQAMFRRDEVSDRQLTERIRSRIGHLKQHSRINAAALDGRVTITGQCAPGDVQALLATIQSTPGVASIVNLLDVQGVASSPSTTA